MTSQLEERPNKTEEKEMVNYGSEETKINPSDYDCQILLEKTTHEVANDKSFPTDARLIWYIVDGVECMDLTRCNKAVSYTHLTLPTMFEV